MNVITAILHKVEIQILATLFSAEELFNSIDKLITPDFHSVSFTGGEPLLHADFIKEFLEEYNFNCLLETNGSLPRPNERK